LAAVEERVGRLEDCVGKHDTEINAVLAPQVAKVAKRQELSLTTESSLLSLAQGQQTLRAQIASIQESSLLALRAQLPQHVVAEQHHPLPESHIAGLEDAIVRADLPCPETALRAAVDFLRDEHVRHAGEVVGLDSVESRLCEAISDSLDRTACREGLKLTGADRKRLHEELEQWHKDYQFGRKPFNEKVVAVVSGAVEMLKGTANVAKASAEAAADTAKAAKEVQALRRELMPAKTAAGAVAGGSSGEDKGDDAEEVEEAEGASEEQA